MIELETKYDDDLEFLVYTFKETRLVKEMMFVQGLDINKFFQNSY